MRDSDTYMAIIDEGREEQAKEDIIELAERRFGAADDANRSKLVAISDLARLKRIFRRLLDAANWQDLLDTP